MELIVPKITKFSKPSIVALLAIACVLGSGGAWYSSTDLPEWSAKYHQLRSAASDEGVYFSFEELVKRCDGPEAHSSTKLLQKFFADFKTATMVDPKTIQKATGSELHLMRIYQRTRPLLPVITKATHQPVVCLPPMRGVGSAATRDWKSTQGVALYLAKWADLAVARNDLEMADECWMALAELSWIKDQVPLYDDPHASDVADYAIARGISKKGLDRDWREKLRAALKRLGSGPDARRVLQLSHASSLEGRRRFLSNPNRITLIPGSGSAASRISAKRDWKLYFLGKLPAFQQATMAHIHQTFANGLRRLGRGSQSIDNIVSATSVVSVLPPPGKLSYAAFYDSSMGVEYLGTRIVSVIARRNVMIQAIAMLDSGSTSKLPLSGDLSRDRDCKALRLKSEPGRVILYSIGDDGGDDHGKVVGLPGYEYTAPDFGVVIPR